MRKVDPLALQTGVDIAFPEARLTIHQPKIKEISMIGELNFHLGSQLLIFDKDKILDDKDKVNLENQNNFDIFMSVMSDRKNIEHKVHALMVLSLLFPNAQIKVEKTHILIKTGEDASSIDAKNFSAFQDIIAQIFCLMEELKGRYNPADALAEAIAKKIKKAEAQKQKQQKVNLEDISVYGKYISILSIGLKKDKNELSDYTIYQLKDEFKRFLLNQDFDMYVKMKLAGAENLEEVEDWMQNTVI